MNKQIPKVTKFTIQYPIPQGEIPIKLSIPLPPFNKLKNTTINKITAIFKYLSLGYNSLSLVYISSNYL